MKLRRCGIVVLVLSTVMFARAPAATAFAGTGTITVYGWYNYQHLWYTGYNGHAGLSVFSEYCIGAWAGTSTDQSGESLCEMQMGGSTSPAPPTTTPPSMYVNGWYQPYDGTPQHFRFALSPPQPLALPPTGFYIPPGYAGATTGGVTSGPYQGLATMTYHFLPPSDSYGCAPYCDPSYYNYAASGRVTFTIDYVLH